MVQYADYELKEKDWKLLRKKLPGWQEAYMDGLVEEYREILNSPGLSSEKFWALKKRIRDDQKNPGVLITDLRRSTMTWTIQALLNYGVITLNDLCDFSEELQARMKYLTEE